MFIQTIVAREILDSRGFPTVEAEVVLKTGQRGRASVPSGASTGALEALELRDKDPRRYLGRGVTKAVTAISKEIEPVLKGVSVENQQTIDRILCDLDGTDNKSRLGSNAILAVSLASARAKAEAENLPLYQSLNEGETYLMPTPMMNILNGGRHANNTLDLQEFMMIPVGGKTFAHALQIGAEIFHALKSILEKRGISTAVGDEGGFAPQLSSNEEALDLLMEATEKAGYRLYDEVLFSLDAAASEFFSDGFYHVGDEKLSSDDMIAWYEALLATYPIASIEDGLHETDWVGWQRLTARLGDRIQLVGDDLFVTNTKILQTGIDTHCANALLVKLNQIGTITETREAISLARKAQYHTIISHRSGETEDSFIADFSVAVGAGQIKAGALSRTDRIAKYNQLLRIEAESHFPYAGKTSLLF